MGCVRVDLGDLLGQKGAKDDPSVNQGFTHRGQSDTVLMIKGQTFVKYQRIKGANLFSAWKLGTYYYKSSGNSEISNDQGQKWIVVSEDHMVYLKL